MHRIKLVILVLFFITQAGAWQNPETPVDERVEELLARMTLEQKVGQMCQYARDEVYENLDVDDFIHLIEQGHVGSFLTITDPEITTCLQRAAVHSQLGIPLLFATDAIHGVGMHPGTTGYPTALTLASSWDENLVQRIAYETAEEMHVIGLHWTFSPNVELSRDPRWGRTGETFGEDPLLVSRMGRAMTVGYENNNVISCAKHFAGGGEPLNGVNFPPMSVSVSDLYELWLPPFKAAVDAGARSFMAAHHEVNGVPCHSNAMLLNRILRDEWDFEGFVVSDWPM